MAERYMILELTVDHGAIDGIDVADVFEDREEALAAWEEEGRYIRNVALGLMYYTQHVFVVERDGRYFGEDGEPIRGIPGFAG